MTKDEALKLALEALEAAPLEMVADENRHMVFLDEKAIAAIKEALAQSQQEPVAWRTFDGEGGYEYRAHEMNEQYAQEWEQRNPNHKGWVEPLYTSSPQRTWVGLTAKEVADIVVYPMNPTADVVKAIEAKLKAKNEN